ncbi:hypothetical protein J6E39_02795 [bacterium]|nr:hypothetical protein [bacterium]
MSQAIKLSEIDNGPVDDWTKEGMAYVDGKFKPEENGQRALSYPYRL